MAPGTAVRATEAAPANIKATADAPSAARPPWWRRTWRRLVTPESSTELQSLRLESLLALLEDARVQLNTGWLQGRWWSVRTTTGEHRVTGRFAASTTPPHQVIGACLVGALVQAGIRQTPGARSEVATAVDIVYEALWESSARAGVAADRALPALTAPRVRLARVQTLTKWNDRPERTHAEVLHVVDRAIARTVQGIVTLPKEFSA
jgi:hypothetical protein